MISQIESTRIFEGQVLRAIQQALIDTAPAIPFAAWAIAYGMSALVTVWVLGQSALYAAKIYKEVTQ